MKVLEALVEIQYGGYAAADQLLFANWPTHFVSIATPGSPHPKLPGWFDGHTLEMSFRDTRNPVEEGAPGVLEIKSRVHLAASLQTGLSSADRMPRRILALGSNCRRFGSRSWR